MLTNTVVEVTRREGIGKNESRRLRAKGQVPGVVYGGDRDPVPISVDSRRLLDILRSESGENSLFTLKLGGTDSTRVVMIRDYQRDPVKGRLEWKDVENSIGLSGILQFRHVHQHFKRIKICPSHLGYEQLRVRIHRRHQRALLGDDIHDVGVGTHHRDTEVGHAVEAARDVDVPHVAEDAERRDVDR